MSVVREVLGTALFVFWLLLLIRVIAEWVFMFRGNSRASGPVATLLEITYTVTDPPIKALRRVIPPLRLGRVQLDLCVIVLFIVIYALQSQI